MVESVTEPEVQAILITNAVTGAISLMGSLFIIFVTNFLSLRHKGTFQLVLYMSIADLFGSVSDLMGDMRSNAAGCYVQAWLDQWPYVCSFLWTSCIAFTYYAAVIKQVADWEARYMRRYHLICWGVPLLLSVLPFTTGSYGPTELGWCWIHTNDSNHTGTIWRFVCFYIPLWLCLGFNCVMLTKLYKGIRDALAAQDGGETGPKANATQARLILYPAVMVLCWILPTINRVLNSVTEPIFVLGLLHAATSSLHGFFNSLVYGLSPQVKRLLWQRCRPEKPGATMQAAV